MAVFDSCESNRVTLDDTQALRCTIEAAENVQGHTVYIMKVQRGPFAESCWQVTRRYSDFDSLNSFLLCSGLDLPLPPKKVFGKLEREFIAERQQGLQNYINYILSHHYLSASIFVKRFLDPGHYSFNFAESSLQHVSMVFRSETRWEIVEPLHDFGWRIRKQYFLIRSKSDPKEESVLSWISFGPDKYLNDKDLMVIVKLLGGLQHSFIYPATFMCVSDKGGLVIYNFLENGTLRDILCKVKPRALFLKKYGKPKAHITLEYSKIQSYGRHMLLALKFLHDRGLHHGHLHSGNVVIHNGVCKLLDIGNSILGVPSMLRPYFIQLKKVQTVENIDVYSFGRVLYEMAFGAPLENCNCDIFPSSCCPELRSVLEAILTKEACKNGLPSVSDLLQHPFFRTSSGISQEEKAHLKIPSQLKESLKKFKEQFENRLKEEQRVIRRNQRLSKVHAQLTSEDEKKRRITERKKQQKINLDFQTSQNGTVNFAPASENIPETGIAATSVTPTAPLPPPPPPPPPLPPTLLPPASTPSPLPSTDRGALLSSIQGFNKTKLKKSETKDCSTPVI